MGLPEVEESSSYGTPALKVRGNFLTRLKEDGETIVLRVDFDSRDAMMRVQPDVFYITDAEGMKLSPTTMHSVEVSLVELLSSTGN